MKDIINILEELMDLNSCETDQEKIDFAIGVYEEGEFNTSDQYKKIE